MKHFISKRTGKIAAIIVAAFVLLFLIWGLFFRQPHSNQQAEQEQANEAPLSRLDKLSIKQAASLTIVYAHLQYKKNRDWQKLYKKALAGQLTYYRANDFTSGSMKIGPYHARCIYVLDKTHAIAVTGAKQMSHAQVIWTGNGQRHKNSLRNIWQSLTPDQRRQADEIAHRLRETKQPAKAKEQTPVAHAGGSGHTGFQLLNIPAAMQGTWYSSTDGPDGDSVTLTAHAINGQTIYNVPGLFTSQYGTSIPALGTNLAGKWENGTLEYVQADSLQTDASGFSLSSIDGNPVLVYGSNGGHTKYFRSKALAEKYGDSGDGDSDSDDDSDAADSDDESADANDDVDDDDDAD